jgi:hypothetical protein
LCGAGARAREKLAAKKSPRKFPLAGALFLFVWSGHSCPLNVSTSTKLPTPSDSCTYSEPHNFSRAAKRLSAAERPIMAVPWRGHDFIKKAPARFQAQGPPYTSTTDLWVMMISNFNNLQDAGGPRKTL